MTLPDAGSTPAASTTSLSLAAALGAALCAALLPAAPSPGQESPALSFEVAVVHVEPTTQVVFKQSAPARFTPTLAPPGFQIKWASSRIIVPFVERKYDDPFVAAVRFSGDTATIELRERRWWWRRRELNPRPEASRERPLHAQPLLISRPRASRRGKTARRQPRMCFAATSGDPARLHPNLATPFRARRVRSPKGVATDG